MKTELLYLVYVTILTGLLWVPYILDRIATWGLTTGSATRTTRLPSRLGLAGW